jgi:hypothetical protein
MVMPCLQEMPAALAFKKEFVGKKVSYVFVSYDVNKEAWAKHSKALGLSNSYLLSPKDRGDIDNDLDISTIPRYVILNQHGNVLATDAPSPSSIKLKELMESLLKK